jgi:formylglycine-generating enzyme required for sulfatase activity
MSRALKEDLTIPKSFAAMFERGMDPIIEYPTKCHPHSKVPNVWPEYNEIIEYRDRIQKRYLSIFDKPQNKRVTRVINMLYEHDAMHVETLLYMYVQDVSIGQRSIIPRPIFEKFEPVSAPNWIQIPFGIVSMGITCPENDDFNNTPKTDFGWDVEQPKTERKVEAFSIQDRPVTVQDYLKFLEEKKWEEELIPSSLVKNSSVWFVKTIYGPIESSYAVNWPVSVSHYQASCFAKHHGARLPTEDEIQLVRMQTPSKDSDNCGFVNLTPTNVKENSGFCSDLVGSGWELTSTVLKPFFGFIKSELYPGYSSDFFDDLHYVVLGGSWATEPRIAKRRTFRNWYQSKYPFIFSKFRLVK